MEEKCLRNMSCRCRLCAGEDISALLNITKSISSNIQYEEGEDGEGQQAPPPPAPMRGVANSPPVPTARRPMANSPPVPSARRSVMNSPPVASAPRAPPMQRVPVQSTPVRDEPMELVSEDDVTMDDLPPVVMPTAQPVMQQPPQPAPMMPTQVPGPPMPEYMDAEMTAPTPQKPLSSRSMSAAPMVAATSMMDADMGQPQAPPVATSNGPIPPVEELMEQIADKNWKVRKEAYDNVKALCEVPGTRGGDVVPLLEVFHKMCEDANASAMEAGIQAVLAYAQHVEPFQKGVVAGVMKRVVDKGFAGRPATVKLCEELVSCFIEAGAAEDTIAALIEGTKNKKPKVPPACAASILESLKAFGPRVIPIQTIKACLPALCESTVNGVRPVAVNIVAEIHRWTSPELVQDVVSNLRQAQKTEYEALTKDYLPGQAVATKYVRGAKPPPQGARAKASSGSGGAGAAAAAPAFDPREFAETVNLLEKLQKTEFRAKLALPKWSEKVEALKIVLDLIGPVPKLANGDFYELVSTLKLLSNDSNVNIVSKSIEVLGALSDGLRKNFTQYARLMYPELMKKLSDKKSVVLNAVNNTLDSFLQHSMTIDMMMEEIRAGVDASKNKAPQARVQTIGFLARSVEKKMINVGDRSLITDVATLFVNAMDDVDPTVRKAAVESFVTLVQSTEQTPDFTSGILAELSRKNPRSFKSVQQALGGSGSAPPSRPSSAGSVGRPGSAPTVEVVDTEMVDAAPAQSAPRAAPTRAPLGKPRGPPSRLAGKAAPEAPSKQATTARKPAAAGSGSGASNGGAGSGGDFAPFSISVAFEEAEGILLELQMEEWMAILEGFSSSKWMERKAAIEHLETFAKQNSSAMNVRVIEAMTVFMSKQVKDFKDSNINVLRSAFQAVGTFAENTAGKFPRGVVCLAVPSGVDKISDKKASEVIRAMILQLCEAVGPTYVLGCIVNHMPNVKAPLVHAEVLTAISECVTDFGVTLCNPRLLVDYSKGNFGLESANPKVRSSAISLLGTMYSQLGPALLPILNLESWKPALAATVEVEFKKVGFDPANAANAKRQIKDADVLAAGAKSDGGALFGRVDVSSQITKELMADLKCEEDKTAWKKRLAAMESAMSICEGAGCAIEFTKPVMELMKGMKARLTDSNANLKIKAAQVIGVLAASIGPEIAKMSKMIVPSLLSGVSDNKKNMQIASVDALHKWVRHSDKTSSSCLESVLSSVAEAMMNPVGRAELLGWLADHLKACDQRLDLMCLVTPTVHGGLLDKSSEAREKAVQVLAEVMKSVGNDVVLTTGCRDIKPAQMRSLKPLFDKAIEMAASTATPPAAPAPAAAPPPQAPVQVLSVPSQQATTAAGGSASRLARTGSMPSRPGAVAGPRPQLSRTTGSFTADTSHGDTMHDHDDQPVVGMLKMNNGKSARLVKGQFNKWIFDPISQSEMSNRKSEIEAEWRQFLSPELHAKLFAPTLEKGMMAAMSDLMACISSQPQEVLAALDLIFKWCTLRVVDNNVQALAKLLEVLVKLFEFLKSIGYHLDDVEAAILLPYLLQESGSAKPRFRIRFRDIMRLVVDVYSTENYVNYLVDCFNTSKNIKSRCECIDLIEHIVKRQGVNSVGKRSVKEIGKYVTAHEKEIRESAINALVAVYIQMGGDLDRFFRYTGVTNQQGMDLLTTKIKYLPPGTVAAATTVSAPAPPQRAGFGFSAPQQPSFSARTPPRLPTAENAATPMSGLKTFNNVSVAAPSSFGVSHHPEAVHIAASHEDEDIVMATPGREDVPMDPIAVISDILLRPLEGLFTEERDIVSAQSPAYESGVQALKGLYTLSLDAAEPAESEFLHKYVNEIAIHLCECVHGSMGRGDPSKPVNLLPLTIALSTLRQLLESPAVEEIQRYVVERILLETTSKLLDARFDDTPIHTDVRSAEFGNLPSDRRRLIYMQKGLNAILAISTKRIRAGVLYPSIVNLLQRIVRNDVGEYNARDSFNHLMQKDSLDQVVGRLLLKVTTMQSEALNPFETIDIFGVLMQMHSFFGTLPQSDVFSVQIANDNMQQALKIIAECMMKTRQSNFERAVNDLPPDSPIRDMLVRMGFSQTVFASSRSLGSSRFSGYDASVSSFASSSSQSFGSAPSTATSSASMQSESITRRLFDAGSSTSSAPASQASSTASVASRFGSFRSKVSGGFGASADGGIRSSFTSSNDAHGLAGSRATISSLGDFATEAPQGTTGHTQTATSRTLRERLERVRGAKS